MKTKLIKFRCNSCLEIVEGDEYDKIIGLCLECQEKFDELIEECQNKKL